MSSGGTAPSWRFLVDENLPRSLVADLEQQVFAAEHVYDLQIGRAKDPAVYAYAQSQRAILLTGDKD